MKNNIKSLLAIGLVSALAGCKVEVIAVRGGDVQSQSGTRDCAEGSVCEVQIKDTNFSESFTVVPKPGYVFSKWYSGDGFLCAKSTNPTCTVSNVGTAGNAGIEAVVASEAVYYIMPVFEFVGIDTDGDGQKDHLDEDDDNDGIFDVDDEFPLDPTNTPPLAGIVVAVDAEGRVIGPVVKEFPGGYIDIEVEFAPYPGTYELRYNYWLGNEYLGQNAAILYEAPDCNASAGKMYIAQNDVAYKLYGPAQDGEFYIVDPLKFAINEATSYSSQYNPAYYSYREQPCLNHITTTVVSTFHPLVSVGALDITLPLHKEYR